MGLHPPYQLWRDIWGSYRRLPVWVQVWVFGVLVPVNAAAMFFVFAMVKAVVPRYRYDQLMRIGWKIFLPLSLAWVVFVAFAAKFEWFWGVYARWSMGG